MRALFGFVGGVLLFLGASCVVAEVLLWTLGGADSLYSLHDLWASLHGPSLASLEQQLADLLGGIFGVALGWLLALPSWLVFLVVGGLLSLGGMGGREQRTFG